MDKRARNKQKNTPEKNRSSKNLDQRTTTPPSSGSPSLKEGQPHISEKQRGDKVSDQTSDNSDSQFFKKETTLKTCCFTRKMLNRTGVAFALLTMFYFIFGRPLYWYSANLMFPVVVMWEYGGIQRGVLNKIGLGYQQQVDTKVNDWRFLTNQLINRLSSRSMSCALLLVYHLVVLTMPQVKMGITLFGMFIFIMGYKISVLDRFIREYKQIAFEWKKDPDGALDKYEDGIRRRRGQSQLIFANPEIDNQQGLDDVKIKDRKNFIPERISSLESLDEIINDPDFNSHCLTITLLNVLLEVFGHVFISLCSSCGYIVYNMNRKFLLLGIHFSQWSDAGGLFCGSYFGKDKFANSISPKKTQQGVIGAFLLPSLMGVLFWSIQTYTSLDFFVDNMGVQNYVFLGASCGFLAVLGDLCESFLKRAAGTKDSGRGLGEHGGFFDRIDSMLLNGPYLVWYVIEFNKLRASPQYDTVGLHILEFLKFQVKW